MKKKLFMMACLAVLGILVVKAQQPIMALHHDGKATFFSSSKIADAFAAAVEGDTIYFSTGMFPSDITITKPITLIGVGRETQIKGNVSIAIPDSVKLIKRLLQTIMVTGNLTVDKPVAGLMISQCWVNTVSFNASVDSSYIDRSVIGNTFYLSSNIKSLNVSTTKIITIQGNCSDVECANFVNCNIQRIFNSWTTGVVNGYATYINCIMYYLDNLSSNTVFVNCLCRDDFYKNCHNTGCWQVNFDIDNAINPKINLDSYIGIDGTVIGAYGTSLPYIDYEMPLTPRVLTHSLNVNDVGTTLTVNLTVGTGK